MFVTLIIWSLIKLLFPLCRCTCHFFGTDRWRFLYPTMMPFDYQSAIVFISCQHTSATICLQRLQMCTIRSLTRTWQQESIRTSTRSDRCQLCDSKQWMCCQSIPSPTFLLPTLIQPVLTNCQMLTDIFSITHFKRWMTWIRSSTITNVSINLTKIFLLLLKLSISNFYLFIIFLFHTLSFTCSHFTIPMMRHQFALILHAHFVQNISGIEQVFDVSGVRLWICEVLRNRHHGVVIGKKFNHTSSRQLTSGMRTVGVSGIRCHSFKCSICSEMWRHLNWRNHFF